MKKKKNSEINIYKLENFEQHIENMNFKSHFNNSFDNDISKYDTMTLNSLYNLSFDFDMKGYTNSENSRNDRIVNRENKSKKIEKRNWRSTDKRKGKSNFLIQDFCVNCFESLRIFKNKVVNYFRYGRDESDIRFNNFSKLDNISSIENKELGKYISEMLKSSLENDQYYTVDRIENNIVVLENRDNLKMVNVDKKNIDFDVCEGDILYYLNGYFEKCDNIRKDIEKTLEEKLNRLWE